MNKYVTNFTRTCFDHWSASKAINEFVQNYLDSDGEQQCDFGSDSIILRNKNICVSNKMLLMGLSDKRGDDSKRGCFGVGSIQAMVVLIDLGYSITIQNNDVVWVPTWEYSEQFDTDVMVILEQEASSPNNHFTVIICGLEDYVIDEVKQRSLAFQDREVLYSTQYGDIISNPSDGEGGEVYVGDLYVCQHKSFKYSYNIKPKLLELSQDRNAVSEYALQELTSKLIVATKDVDFIKAAIESQGRDTWSVNAYSFEKDRQTPSEVDDEFAKDFLKENRGYTITNDYDEHKKMEKLGNKSVYEPNARIAKSVQKSSLYLESLEDVKLVEEEPFKDLLEKLLDMLDDKYENRDYLNIANKSLIDEIRNRLDEI